eukprot:4719209-Amphidinium_carterae.1
MSVPLSYLICAALHFDVSTTAEWLDVVLVLRYAGIGVVINISRPVKLGTPIEGIFESFRAPLLESACRHPSKVAPFYSDFGDGFKWSSSEASVSTTGPCRNPSAVPKKHTSSPQCRQTSLQEYSSLESQSFACLHTSST